MERPLGERNEEFTRLAERLARTIEGKDIRYFGVTKIVKHGDTVFRFILADSHDDEGAIVFDMLPEIARLFVLQTVDFGRKN